MDWVKAPPLVELEIRGVWLEDDMPDEIKNAPGRVPFTLSAESQEWVDSMLEVKDAGKYIVGLPRPVAPAHHRPLNVQPSSQPPPPPPRTAPRTSPAPSTSPPPTLRSTRPAMPDIETPPQPRPMPKRTRMPDIADVKPAQTSKPSPVQEPASETRMPDIDERRLTRAVMPDIEDGATEGTKRVNTSNHETMPDIGTGDTERIERGRMPDIGEG